MNALMEDWNCWEYVYFSPPPATPIPLMTRRALSGPSRGSGADEMLLSLPARFGLHSKQPGHTTPSVTTSMLRVFGANSQHVLLSGAVGQMLPTLNTCSVQQS
ncbi:hypothetical protein E2C01_091288 [Portunus trituberculatus]|uniref:Uncharacterized protein n=1 Tax=Portunus trituberculatus TaxID=210409 RepID=A0A5B7JIQ7_PORTR|nr:hypothetical protein [Portunus trituberculatus]